MPKLLKLTKEAPVLDAPEMEASLTVVESRPVVDPFVMLAPYFKRRPNRIVKGMPFEEYKRLPAINGSMLKYQTSLEMVDSMTDPDDDTAAKTLGSLTHSAILEPHLFENGEWGKTYQVWTATAGLTTKAALAHLAHDPRMLITVDMLDTAKRCRDAVWKHKEACRLLLDPGDCEVTGEVWDNEMMCMRKCRIDRLPHGTDKFIIDIKTTRHRVSQLHKLKSQVFERFYHGSQAGYLDQLAMLEGQRRPGSALIWVRNEKPFMCRVTLLEENSLPDKNLLEDGRKIYQERLAALVLGYVERNFEGFENESISPILTK